RRPPEDHRVELAPLDGRAEHAPGPEQVLLAHDLVEGARPHAIGKRRRRRRSSARCTSGRHLEQLHARYLSRAASRSGRVAKSVRVATGSIFQRSNSPGLARYAMNGTPTAAAASPSTHESPTM